MSRQTVLRVAWALVPLLILPNLSAQNAITPPVAQFGFDLGDDYQLANYTQLEEYWKKLASESDRMTLEIIGETAEGRPMYMAILTSPANHANLDRYKEISRRLALAETESESEARALAKEGRAVVWIDGGLHADEVLGAQQLVELVYQMVSAEDEETLRFLEDTILLAVCVNPDGMELVSDWYMRDPNPARRSLAGLPRLFHKYAGHDNNRDFYMSSQPETEAINRILYREWFPQIVYNHHQTGPEGAVLFAPPFRDPFNYNFDPLIVTSIDLIAGAMHSRFLAEGKPGAAMRSAGPYSTWWNGGLRTSPYFHNMIGLLTETIGSPTPTEIPFLPRRQLPSGDYPSPIGAGTWRFRDSIEYSMTANRAVLDIASRYRDTLLFNIWRMGRNSVERGSRDSWTITPDRVSFVEGAIASDQAASPPEQAEPARYQEMLRNPESRDPRGYIVPFNQPDFPTATKFINALLKNGIAVGRATEPFEVNGKSYSEGSFVIQTAQAFRPHVLDMFEPQKHPDDFPYPGAPPTPPYDMTGWTLAYQMGVEFDRILDGFDPPTEAVDGQASVPEGAVTGRSEAAGFFLSHTPNDAFVAVNRLLRGGDRVYWLRGALRANGRNWPAGTMYVPAGPETTNRLESLAAGLGLTFEGVRIEPESDALELLPVRIGLWDRYGGSEASGWARFILENFEFPFEVVYPRRLDRGGLASRFDVLILVDGAIPAGASGPAPSVRLPNVPEEYARRLGAFSTAETVPQLREFLEDGGTVITIGGSTVLAEVLDLPISSALVERTTSGDLRPLGSAQFYIPGSLLRLQIDASHPLAYGLGPEVDVMFNNSPAFSLNAGAGANGVKAAAWFGADPLRSGWAWGADRLDGAAAVIEASVGGGKLFLFGPEIAFRAQSHGAYKFLFNGIYYGHAREATLGNNPGN